MSLPVAQIKPNPFQPRKSFDQNELDELEVSLRSSGLLQPITVRPVRGGLGYELIAGERRLRAATQLGWTEIPAVVKDIDDRTLLTLALVENLQRTDLNPIEEARGYQQLMSEFSLTQQQVAELIGKDRSTVANMLRLLQLPEVVREMLQAGQLTLGHARAILGLADEGRIVSLAREIVARGLTVRDVERRARESATITRVTRKSEGGRRLSRATSAEARRIEDELRSRLQTDVKLSMISSDRGRIEVAFYSLDDLDRLLDILLGPERNKA
ncbi:MAG: ParB/RepB/Spo0J family partition protein [Gemmatimonadaceae bacterium]